ncbi:DUF4278 domain-containing protein [Acaryochloris sp. IP29b_bin.148]|uniref:DUF4278 domain-containing protein n=1 Tax=Acaryochloris sp. IP29b_bin.148 TaxID=2969218 RepID=UPI0026071E46|nr:DUF4278 domain-containing protein [Acaryochloris sp. IP29b_bin.148]
MQLTYRNVQYTATTAPTFIPTETLQGTYRGRSMPITIHPPTPSKITEQTIQYRGVKTQQRFA